ncbi:MAG: alpha/beta hydrolase [Ramlibacter sp.]|nr:alpha/beta hydrolase [Ramlibacter sp.]
MKMDAITFGTGAIKVVGIHGWLGTSQSWKSVFPLLDRERFTYAFLDARGYGSNFQVPGRFDVDEYANDAIRFCRSSGWDRFCVMGHSMGGKVAQRIAATQGSGVQKIVAVTPVPASGVPFDEATFRFFESAAGSRDVRAEIVQGSSGGQLTRTWSRAMADASMQDIDQAAFRSYFLSWSLKDFSSDVQGCTVPIKVIVGENDPSLTRNVMRATLLKWFPNHALSVLEACGHYPMDEVPVRFITEVESFLAA